MTITNLDEPKSDPRIILEHLKNEFKIEEIRISSDDFKSFCSSAAYPHEYEILFGSFFKEKLLEHYLSLRLLNLSPGDRFIDIAASHSFFSEFVFKKGIESYKQDLVFTKGISFAADSKVPLIGGNAADLPFKDNYFSKMSLHCSIEHFELHDDIDFITEASRVLQKGGKICILPLYFGEIYHIVTDPDVFTSEKNSIRFEEEVPVYFKKGFGNRHCRVYSVEEFKKRIANPDIWSIEIFHIANLQDIGEGLYCEYSALFTKK